MSSHKHEIYSGWLEKKSKYLGVWRNRWTVLTTQHLLTYKNKNLNDKPTEIIEISSIKTMHRSSYENTFCIEGNNIYEFKAVTEFDREQWILTINNCRNDHKCIEIKPSMKFEFANENINSETKFISSYQKQMVNLYLKPIERMLICKLIIPQEIYNLVALFCGSNYVSKHETFTRYNNQMTIVNDTTLLNTNRNASTAYGDIIVYGLFQNKHIWQIHIDRLSDNWGWKQPIIIGIAEISEFHKPTTELNGIRLYGYDNFGRLYFNGIHNKSKKYASFKEGNIILILYNGKTGTLQGYKYKKKKNNGKTGTLQGYKSVEKWTTIDNINTNSNYRLIISIYGKNDQVSVKQYKCEPTYSKNVI